MDITAAQESLYDVIKSIAVHFDTRARSPLPPGSGYHAVLVKLAEETRERLGHNARHLAAQLLKPDRARAFAESSGQITVMGTLLSTYADQLSQLNEFHDNNRTGISNREKSLIERRCEYAARAARRWRAANGQPLQSTAVQFFRIATGEVSAGIFGMSMRDFPQSIIR
jgi:hypothetical protein